ncbi:putative agmatinase 1 [Colletotrichum orbiculare MAFF 240422]|uniref:Agmatinase 1 n=1 Tax=Colletotrichum orbiculare (strain 104-T / ATCC 96160 / CBS 514.97 / LARS 414 / MAFF 240422) TaxID=1213857 RepID=N4VUM1_COLOR|nr:putative agmatinase 1 [Colletotrichum orbiculare MAFF 240422]
MHLSPAAVLIVNCVAVAAWRLPHPALANSPHQISLTLDKGDDDDFDVTSADSIAGLRTFANLPFVDCFSEAATNQKFDIAVFGAPHDTTTTGRPGARFGPPAIRTGSQRKGPGEWSVYTGRNPLQSWATVVDCGDASLTWLDNTVSLKRLDKAHKVISGRSAANTSVSTTPRILTLGGDHTTTLSALRSTYARWGPVSVIHFDSHIDTWDPAVLGGGISDYAGLNHGTFLHIAHEEHLILNNSIHAGIRAPLIRRKGDVRNDVRCGFEIVTARDIDKFGMSGVISRVRERVRDSKVYISVDIDVLDPAYAPATGTAEPGGWSTRELLTILEGLEGLAVVGGDVVEVAPAYDNNGETTVLAAAEIAYSLIDLMVVTPVRSKADLGDER